MGLVMLVGFLVNIGMSFFLLKKKIGGGRRRTSSNRVKSSSAQKKKIIPQDEGEYVDFEEVKEVN